ncbi:hypothetical protein IE53DRAFT_254542 [Violaceomyces palustris]|uniref:Uncharacterized protein n=1 Tax=Violaceomyces palustris TaxID=1673888 RepID=A0ACD0NNK0_9BASI|nr:hypothetical protein IE53DRAFT_254542 [Violaceomyces palustris]
MGCVFSCLASCMMWTGELLENLMLAIGEIGSVLVRGVFAIVVGLLDVLAAASCCYRVPWSERPDREFYTYSSLGREVGGRSVLKSTFSKQARKERRQIKEARAKERELMREAKKEGEEVVKG